MSNQVSSNVSYMTIYPPTYYEGWDCRITDILSIPKKSDFQGKPVITLSPLTKEQLQAVEAGTYDRKPALAMTSQLSDGRTVIVMNCKALSCIIPENIRAFHFHNKNIQESLIYPLPDDKYSDLTKKVAQFKRTYGSNFEADAKEREGVPTITLGDYQVVHLKSFSNWNFEKDIVNNIYITPVQEVFESFINKGIYSLHPLTPSVMDAVANDGPIHTPIVFETRDRNNNTVRLNLLDKGASWLISRNVKKFQINSESGQSFTFENREVRILSGDVYDKIVSSYAVRVFCAEMMEVGFDSVSDELPHAVSAPIPIPKPQKAGDSSDSSSGSDSDSPIG